MFMELYSPHKWITKGNKKTVNNRDYIILALTNLKSKDEIWIWLSQTKQKIYKRKREKISPAPGPNPTCLGPTIPLAGPTSFPIPLCQAGHLHVGPAASHTARAPTPISLPGRPHSPAGAMRSWENLCRWHRAPRCQLHLHQQTAAESIAAGSLQPARNPRMIGLPPSSRTLHLAYKILALVTLSHSRRKPSPGSLCEMREIADEIHRRRGTMVVAIR
jgi:hypothetical protein